MHQRNAPEVCPRGWFQRLVPEVCPRGSPPWFPRGSQGIRCVPVVPRGSPLGGATTSRNAATSWRVTSSSPRTAVNRSRWDEATSSRSRRVCPARGRSSRTSESTTGSGKESVVSPKKSVGRQCAVVGRVSHLMCRQFFPSVDILDGSCAACRR